MRLMPICRKPDTRKPAKGDKTCPCPQGGLRGDRPDQLWCAETTSLPMRRGFVDLVTVLDWFTSFAWTDRLKWIGTRILLAGYGRWITFWNHQRPHAARGGQPPAMVCFNSTQADRRAQAAA
jgi:putative transposase